MAKRWTTERLDQLRELAATLPASEIAAALGCTPSALSNAALRHGIKIAKRKGAGLHGGQLLNNWTAEDDRNLLMLAGYLSSKKIGLRLGRTSKAVRERARKLRVRLAPRAGTIREVAEYLGVSVRTVAIHRKKLNQEWRSCRSVAGAVPEQIAAVAKSILDGKINALKASPRRLAKIAAGKDPDQKVG